MFASIRIRTRSAAGNAIRGCTASISAAPRRTASNGTPPDSTPPDSTPPDNTGPATWPSRPEAISASAWEGLYDSSGQGSSAHE
ncbi:hypothetical protein [Pseudarthrobacter albicanus]|uniref:hypothetical protein n=1 Tax=Pseudarthrobacter albicanus TaxID=2823873 RepID=UPI001BAB9A98|nr:hypothetical protein [Pseudarthrobacter albicanus]